ncbi:MAG: beta-ketoacyl-ACP synthase II [Dehalococcoidales bacterium]|nr:beta-ketoacyl-ACP synthase II [Dehalococcoidales bacterium]
MINGNSRVVVTGIGMVNPLGLDTSTTWEGLISGKSGIDYITSFDTEQFNTKIAGEIKDFIPTDYVNRKDARHMDRFAQIAVAASREAMKQSGLEIVDSNQDNIGVIIGSGIGGLNTLFKQTKVLLDRGPQKVSPFLIPMMITDMAASQVSIALGIKGPNLCVTSACSSGSDAIGAAFELIKRGDIQAMIAGGSESTINEVCISAFNALNALSTRNNEPQLASRPFDAEREGFVIGEGSCILVLENLLHAQKRGANILAEVVGYGASADAYHITQPIESGAGAARAMEITLQKAGLVPSDINYINAHGTSTQLNDRMETNAIKAVFGDYASNIAISSTKSMTGHLIGCAGAIEAAICILVILNGIIPPTINLTHPDPECDLDYVPNTARQAKVVTAQTNSFGFGGHNSVLIFQQYNEA